MLVKTIVYLFCTSLSKQFIILTVGYKWSHCLDCFPFASSRVDQINSDFLAAKISTAIVKRHDCLTFDTGYFIHVYVELIGGSDNVYIDATIDLYTSHFSHGSSNLQLSSAAFHLF